MHSRGFFMRFTLESVIPSPYVYKGQNPLKHVIQVKLIPAIALIILISGSSPVRPAATFLSRPTTALSLPVSAAPARVLSYLALGDSYTIGESVDPADRYPVQAVRMLNGADHLSCQDPDIIAVTGWTTGNLLNAVEQLKPAVSYRMVSLLIGVNNQYQGRSQSEYRDQFALLLQKSILLAGNDPSHVLVLSIPDYSVTPFGRTRDTSLIAAQIDSFNGINRSVAADYKVHYIDVTTESRKAASDPSLIAADGLHFSGKEYGRWARLMEPWLREMLR
jgi:lysophospholipase L1-like esterase